jgi:hypothetical protein
MGLLSNWFGGRKKKREAAKIDRLPSGSFTVDANGSVLTSTLPVSFPKSVVTDMGAAILESFASAADAGLPVNEMHLHYGGLKITARQQRGGAMIFIAPLR